MGHISKVFLLSPKTTNKSCDSQQLSFILKKDYFYYVYLQRFTLYVNIETF